MGCSPVDTPLPALGYRYISNTFHHTEDNIARHIHKDVVSDNGTKHQVLHELPVMLAVLYRSLSVVCMSSNVPEVSSGCGIKLAAFR